MKRNYLKIASLIFAGALLLNSCSKEGCTDPLATNYDEKAKKDDNSCLYENNEEDSLEITVSANITSDVTWETGKAYILAGRIAVVDGATLTIEPGVVVKGEAGAEANATALIIARGAKIMAEGTANDPIIFTSVADNIEPGDIASPNMSTNLRGYWGGLIVLGKAPISADAESVQIEGIPATDQNGLYGGTVEDDNSGVLKYISIRHGGTNIGADNEINGLTLGGVGSGTVIENVEIVANQDDGIEIFGGTVNLKNVIVLNTGDDAIDTDQAWAGTLDNFIVINPGDECLELDGGEGSFNAKHTLKNGSLKAEEAEGIADLDNDGTADGTSNSYVDIQNLYVFGLTIGQDFDDNPATLTATSIQVVLPTVDADGNAATYTLADFFKHGSDVYATSVTTASVGADKSKFTSWTWADVEGELSDF